MVLLPAVWTYEYNRIGGLIKVTFQVVPHHRFLIKLIYIFLLSRWLPHGKVLTNVDNEAADQH